MWNHSPGCKKPEPKAKAEPKKRGPKFKDRQEIVPGPRQWSREPDKKRGVGNKLRMLEI